MSDHGAPPGAPNDERPYTILPNPDPSRLTTMQLHRELHLLEKILTQRLMAVETAYNLLREDMVRVPTVLDREIERLTQLTDQKFSAVELRFSERDKRFTDNGIANKTAIDKSEYAVVRQLQAIEAVVTSNNAAMADKLEGSKEVAAAAVKALDEKIGAAASRIGEVTAANRGVREERIDKRLDLGSVMGMISLCFVLLSAFVGVVLYVTNRAVPIYLQAAPNVKAVP